MIKSNIKQVIRRLERFEAGLPMVAERAVEPKRWLPLMKNRARLALEAVVTPEERKWADLFAESVTATVFEKGVRWEIGLGGKLDQMPDLEAAQKLVAEGHGSKGRRVPMAQGEQELLTVEQVRRVIADWVATPEAEGGKRRRQIDEGLDDQELTERMYIIMGVHQKSRKIGQTEEMADATERIYPHLLEFMVSQQLDKRLLQPGRVKTWLRVVLQAWRELLMDQMPRALGQELRGWWKQTGETLL
jgi:hypothetical protein